MEGGDDPKRRRIDQSSFQSQSGNSRQRQQISRASIGGVAEQNSFLNQPLNPVSPGSSYTLETHQFHAPSYQQGTAPYNIDYGQVGHQHLQHPYPAQYASSPVYGFTPPQGYGAHLYESVQRRDPLFPGNYVVSPQSYVAGHDGDASLATTTIAPAQSLSEVEHGVKPYIGSAHSTLADDAAGPQSHEIMALDPSEPGVPQLNNSFQWYHLRLRHTFEDLRDGKMNEASTSLRLVTNWLLRNVEALGLTRDSHWIRSEQSETDEMKAWRLQLWQNFNHCWLGLLQKQREISQQELNTGHKRNRISRDELEHMGNELVGWCEIIQEYGLVDYEIGVWEEQIVDLLNPCCEIAMKIEGEPDSSSRSNAEDTTAVRPSKRRR